MHLIFDTETTGLPRDWKAPVTDTTNWPRVVQLAYHVYSDSQELLKEVNEIIYPDGFEIPADAARVHGITTKIAKEKGVPLTQVLSELLQDVSQATNLVAHNASFDAAILDAELVRENQQPVFTRTQLVCTMKQATPVCKLPGRYGYKWPKLEELYTFLFDEDLVGAHDANIDVQATAKCYFALKDLAS